MNLDLINKLVDLIEAEDCAVALTLIIRDKHTKRKINEFNRIWRYIKARTGDGTVFMVNKNGDQITEFNLKDVRKVIFEASGKQIHVTRYV